MRVRTTAVIAVACVLAALGAQALPVARARAATPLCGSMVGVTPHITKVLWIVMENRSYGTASDEIPGSPSASYIDGSLLSQCGSASDYHPVTHPSFPNYIAMTSGGTQGVTSDSISYVTGPSIFSEVDPSWRSYEEFMPAPCDHVTQTGTDPPSQYYLDRHNPAANYSSLPVGAPTSGDCQTNDVPLGTTSSGALLRDVTGGTLPRFSFVTPGECDDMHMVPVGDTSCPDEIKGGDSWLATWIPIITSGPDYTSGHLLIDVAWDEARGGTAGEDCINGTGADCIAPNIVISPYTSHVVSGADFTHYSLLKTTEELLGVPLLGHAADPGTVDMCGPYGLCAQPQAVFTSSCAALSCGFNGSGSSAPGGSVTGYSWRFGDGQTASGATPNHSYAAPGTYPVTLTVTTAGGQSAASTQQVTVASAGGGILFVGSAATAGKTATETVSVPSAVAAGDAMILIGSGVTTSSLSAPSGWTLLRQVSNPVMTTDVWTRVATAADSAAAVTVALPGAVKGTLQLTAYSGTSRTAPVASSVATTAHVSETSQRSPTATASSGQWVALYWVAKSSTLTAWTPPVGTTSRGAAYAGGGGALDSILVDGGAPATPGQVGGLVATGDQAFSAATALTVLLAPAG